MLEYHLTQEQLRNLIRESLGLFNCQANDEALDKMIEEFLPCQSKV